ncbi:hypothetical protein O2N63_02435 [Aliiroseovarius sp. KMU-50]|uniref:Lipoprotein n=1 Tax=Aliiroseovarius salicola TaxID=3009082 RepID=A0ABT4VXG1_9RHOB|nr:hypothetical protein [Aliiroseovarius sp. KMU-50]MDA5092932.1 hypothetical protein [Aliiroseovarius sp. KMU-50]
MTRIVLLLLVLAGCQAKPTTSSVTFVPDLEGILVLPHDKRIDFGRSPMGVVPILDREMGMRKVRSLSGCPADITARYQWGDLVLSFTPERFVGWRKGARSQGLTCAS